MQHGEIIETETETDEEDCAYCTYSNSRTGEDGTVESGLCAVCNHNDCNVNQACDEEWTQFGGGVPEGCSYTSITDVGCGQVTAINQDCDEYICTQTCTQVPDGCNFTCDHSSDCQENC